MRIDVRTRGLQIENEMRETIVRRVAFGLGRFGTEVHAVHVCIEDVNGPRGGEDKRCRLTAHGERTGRLVVECSACSPTAAVDGAVDALVRRLTRLLGRRVTMRRRGLAPSDIAFRYGGGA